MKHLKRFFESSDQNIDIIVEYFFNIKDDLEDICNFNLKQNTSSYYTVTITSTVESPSQITLDSVDSINTWIRYNSNDSKILQELKSSISRLQDEDIIESFSLNKINNGYELFIYTRIKEDEDVSDWIFVNEDYMAWIDESRLKKYIKDKFDVSVSSAVLQEEYSKYNERFIELEVGFMDRLDKSKLDQIKRDILSKKITTPDDDIDVFSEAYGGGVDSNWISFVLHYSIVDFE